MRKSRAYPLCTALVAAAVLVGCGSSNTPKSSSGSTTQSETPKSEIPVGVLGAFSGPFAAVTQPGRLAVEAWAKAVNAKGGISGHPVKLYVEDDKGVSASSLTLLKKLVEENHVVAIVGEQSVTDDAWAAYLKDKNIPVVGGNSTHLSFFTNADYFAVGGNLLTDFYGVSDVAKSHGSKWGFLYCAELSACAGAATIMQAYTPSTGVAVAYQGKVAATATDFTAQCQGLKDAGVQSYTISLATNIVGRVAAQCAQQGVKPLNIWPTGADSTNLSDPAYNGMDAVDLVYPFFDESIPAAKEMHETFRQYAPTLGTASAPLSGAGAVMSYLGGKLFEAAVKAAGTDDITGASVKKGLYALKGETLGGMAQPLTYTEGKPNLFNCYYYYKTENGKWVTPKGLTPICAPNDVIDGVAAKFK